MYTLIISQIKFKKNQEKLENLLITYAFKNITNDSYIGKLSYEDSEKIKKELQNITQEQDNILLIRLCNKCFKKTLQFGKKINLKEEKYVIL